MEGKGNEGGEWGVKGGEKVKEQSSDRRDELQACEFISERKKMFCIKFE